MDESAMSGPLSLPPLSLTDSAALFGGRKSCRRRRVADCVARGNLARSVLGPHRACPLSPKNLSQGIDATQILGQTIRMRTSSTVTTHDNMKKRRGRG